MIVMAGPCSAETEEQVNTTAAAVKKAGAKILRGGAFKPRSSPYSFQGLGEEGLRMLRDAANQHDMKLVSEVMDISQIEVIDNYARHVPAGRAQHAELHAAARAGPDAQGRAAQARHRGDDRGVAALGRVHPGRRQQPGRALRARHPHVRELHAQHARHLGDPRRQEAEPPADHRGPEPRHGTPRQGRADGARGASPPAPMASSSRFTTIPITR